MVTTSADSAEAIVVGSLRWAILQANATTEADRIEFAISPAGLATITPQGPLPAVTQPVVIDGTTQPTGALAAGTLVVELNGTTAGTAASGLTITGPDVTVKGLAINRFGNLGIFVNGATAARPVIEGNIIGLDPTGEVARGNAGGGIQVRSATDAVIRNNVVSANGTTASVTAVVIGFGTAGRAVVAGNLIGLDKDGETALPNSGGAVNLTNGGDGGHRLGGTALADRNVILGTVSLGGANNLVQGNYLGTNKAGTARLGPGGFISIGQNNAASSNLLIGGTAAGAGNVITDGIGIAGANTTGTTVRGNSIGTNAAGTARLATGTASLVTIGTGADNTLIGGDDDDDGDLDGVVRARNLIAGRVRVEGGGGLTSDDTVIAGNLIGVDATGNTSLVSGIAQLVGVTVSPTNGPVTRVVIGGTTAGAGNVISGFDLGGGGFAAAVAISAPGVRVQGNRIGTNAAGTAAVRNGTAALGLGTSALSLTAADFLVTGNQISGNTGTGVSVFTTTATGVIAGNLIGTDAAGTAALPNGRGVGLGDNGPPVAVAGDLVIGGRTPADRNVISGNAEAGVFGRVTSGRPVFVRGNHVGTDRDGTAAVPNGGDGVYFQSGTPSGVVIGGPNPGDGNLISGNGGAGVALVGTAGVTVAGNNIGTDAAGAPVLGNAGWGVDLSQSADVTVAANAVTGNALGGVRVTGPDAYGVRVTDNAVEVNTGGDGVLVAAGAGNVAVNGNTINTNSGDGVDLSDRLRLSANVVFPADGTPGREGGGGSATPVGGVGYAAAAVDRGFDLNGTTAYVNSNITDDDTADLFVSAWVRFDTPVPDGGPRTLVSKQSADGASVNFRVYRDADGRLKLLTRAAGVDAVVDSGLTLATGPLWFVAVAVRGTAVTFDARPFGNPYEGGQTTGTVPAPRPATGATPVTFGAVLAGSTPSQLLDGLLDDVQIRRGGAPTPREVVALYDDARGSGISSNVIGVFPNGGAGVRIGGGARNTRIDGGNGITVNGAGGVVLAGGAGTANVSGVRVEGNFVGLDETPPPGGVRPAVLLTGNVTDTRVAFNTLGRFAGPGVSLVAADGLSPVRNRLVGNSFAGSAWPAVDLGGDGPTANDPGDADAGPNNLQNFPTFSAKTGPETRAAGTVTGLPNATYTVEVYQLLADGSGAFPIGTVGVTTNAAGVGQFDVTLPVATAAGDGVAATATDPAGNTSELGTAAPNPTAVTGFRVNRGQAQRSFVRYLDVTFDVSPAGLVAADRVRLVRRDLTGNNPVVVALPAGAVSVSGNALTVDFGPLGVGGNRNSVLGDGYYTLEVDLDWDGTFDVGRSFYRLLGDTDGDRRVDDADVARIAAGIGVAFAPELDVNGDGVVNTADRLLALRYRGRALAAGLRLDG